MESPVIVCIGVIGKLDNPVHISVFPPHEDSRSRFTLLLNCCLDNFVMRQQQVSVDQDLGLLHSFDERLAAYGWLTNTGVKFIVIVDMLGSTSVSSRGTTAPLHGIQESDLKPVFRALQTAYIRLLQNPFHSPNDESSPMEESASSKTMPTQSMQKFIHEIRRIGQTWHAGMSAV